MAVLSNSCMMGHAGVLATELAISETSRSTHRNFMISPAEFVDQNFNLNNPFHRAVKKFGYVAYVQVIFITTTDHQRSIAACEPITDIFLNIRNRALELFDNANFMSGLKLQNELGL